MLAALRQRRSELTRQRRAVAREERELQHSQTDVLQLKVARVIWLLYALAGAIDPRPAILVFMRSRARFSNSSDDELLTCAERSFLAADVAEIAQLSNEAECFDVQALRIARRLLIELKLVNWCKALNGKGIAPATADLLREARVS